MAADPTNAGRGGNRSSGTARTGGIVAARPSARSVHGGGPRGTAGQRRVPLRARGRDTDREPLARACPSAGGHVALLRQLLAACPPQLEVLPGPFDVKPGGNRDFAPDILAARPADYRPFPVTIRLAGIAAG